MILTGKEIQKRIGNDIVITPYSENNSIQILTI